MRARLKFGGEYSLDKQDTLFEKKKFSKWHF
jgi:hypothetical protein